MSSSKTSSDTPAAAIATAPADEGPTEEVVIPEAPQLDDNRFGELTTLLQKTKLYSEFVRDQARQIRSTLTEQRVHAQCPLMKGGTMHEHQHAAVEWLVSLYMNGMNGILADEMGLGKTIVVVGFLAELWSNFLFGPHLIVAPLSTLENWATELSKWCPFMPVLTYHGKKEERAEMRARVQAFQNNAAKTSEAQMLGRSAEEIGSKVGFVLLTSFEIAMRDKTYLKKVDWTVLVVDEAHRLKNFNCRLIRDLKELTTANRVLLTGTPLQNKLSELWSILNFVMPQVFPTLSSFGDWFEVDNLEDYDDEKVSTTILHSTQQQETIHKIHQILAPFVMRRLKSEVGIALPPKREVVVRCPFTPSQLVCYRRVAEGSMDKQRHNKLMQLRKVCAHPYLFPELDPLQNGTVTTHSDEAASTLQELLDGSGKLKVLDYLLQNLHKNGHKVVVFSQLTTALDVLERYFNARGVNNRVVRLDGNVKYESRMEAMRSFKLDPNIDTFLISTRAGGVGLNLQVADTVILYDSDFNPQNDLQAMDRCHRLGQTRPVVVYRLIVRESVEEMILQRCEQKLRMQSVIIERGQLHGTEREASSTFSLAPGELEAILQRKIGDRHEALTEFDPAALEALLDRQALFADDRRTESAAKKR
eukprot:PhM_4_TR3377/c0_g1_i1/m.4525/K19001/HELLS, DDM1; ATP-dependent DNA helicase